MLFNSVFERKVDDNDDIFMSTLLCVLYLGVFRRRKAFQTRRDRNLRQKVINGILEKEVFE